MFRYFILRPERQLFCYLYGCALALVQMVLFSPVSRASGFYLVALSVALFWAGLALYTQHRPDREKPEVSSVGIPRRYSGDGRCRAMKRPGWNGKSSGKVGCFASKGVSLQAWPDGLSKGLLYTPAVMLVGIGILAWGSPQDAIRLINALRNMPAAELVHQIGFVLCFLQISVISVLIADVVAGRGLPNVFRRALLDRLPASSALSEEDRKMREDDRKTHRGKKGTSGIKYMAKILMMAGSIYCCAEFAGISGAASERTRSNRNFPRF